MKLRKSFLRKVGKNSFLKKVVELCSIKYLWIFIFALYLLDSNRAPTSPIWGSKTFLQVRVSWGAKSPWVRNITAGLSLEGDSALFGGKEAKDQSSHRGILPTAASHPHVKPNTTPRVCPGLLPLFLLALSSWASRDHSCFFHFRFGLPEMSEDRLLSGSLSCSGKSGKADEPFRAQQYSNAVQPPPDLEKLPPHQSLHRYPSELC